MANRANIKNWNHTYFNTSATFFFFFSHHGSLIHTTSELHTKHDKAAASFKTADEAEKPLVVTMHERLDGHRRQRLAGGSLCALFLLDCSKLVLLFCSPSFFLVNASICPRSERQKHLKVFKRDRVERQQGFYVP